MGDDGSYDLSSCQLYNPDTGEWTVVGSLSEARYGHTATLLSNGRVLVAGGYDILATCEFFDPVTQSWSSAANMDKGRRYPASTLLDNGKLLMVSGMYGSYDPTCELLTYLIPDDLIAPQVNNQNPDDNETEVMIDKDVYFAIRDPLLADGSFYGVDRFSLNVTVDSSDAIIDGEFQAGFSGVIIPDEIGGFLVTIYPDSTFGSGQTIAVTIDAQDLAPTPNTMPQASYSFTTE